MIGEIIKYLSLTDLFAFRHTSRKIYYQIVPTGLYLTNQTSIALFGKIKILFILYSIHAKIFVYD
jgi:hypothetical protein